MRRMLALAVLSLPALVACGASDPVAAEEISAAVAKTAESGSSRIEISGTDDGEALVMAGIADYERRRASFRFEKAPKEWKGGPEEAFRVIGGTMYVASSIFGVTDDSAKKLKPWVKFEYDRDDEASLDTLLFPFPFVDPGQLLATFQKVGGDVEALGEEPVRGVPASRYRLTLDLERLIETAPPRHRAGLRKELDERGRKLEPVEIWIDGAGLARRVRIVVDSDPVSIDFFDFGIEVGLQAPAADQVEDLDAFFPTGDTEVGSGSSEIEPVEEDE